MRKFKIITPSGRIVIESNAATFGELRQHENFPVIDLNKNEVTIKGSDVSLRLDTAALPETDTVMYVSPKEQKAGMSNRDFYHNASTAQLKEICEERDIDTYHLDREDMIEELVEDDNNKAEAEALIRENENKINFLKNSLIEVRKKINEMIDSIEDENYEIDMEDFERIKKAVKCIK